MRSISEMNTAYLINRKPVLCKNGIWYGYGRVGE